MQTITYFKLLADDTRLRILMLIYQAQELCVCELTAALALSQPKISRHIALLRSAGLLSDRRDGKWVYYSLSSSMPQWQQQLLQVSCTQEQAELVLMMNQLNQAEEGNSRQQLCR